MKDMKADTQTVIENLSKWLLDQVHRASFTDKQFNSLLVISRARFGRDVPALLMTPVVAPLFPASPEIAAALVAKPRRTRKRKV